MGLCARVVCVLLYDGATGALVKGERFAKDRRVGDLLQAARVHARRQVDELVLLDVTATQERREPNYALVERVTRECFVPVAVGGGVRTAEHVQGLLRVGADKVVIGTAAIENPAVLGPLAQRFGSQCLTVAIDVRWDFLWMEILWLIGRAGAGEILLTSVNRDGTLKGYDLDMCQWARGLTSLPIVLAGGAGTYAHLAEGLDAGADAVAVGAMWQFTEQTPLGAAHYLTELGYRVRVPERLAA